MRFLLDRGDVNELDKGRAGSVRYWGYIWDVSNRHWRLGCAEVPGMAGALVGQKEKSVALRAATDE